MPPEEVPEVNPQEDAQELNTNSSTESRYSRQELNATIIKRFNKDGIRSICFELDIEFDDLPGNTKKAKARELILYCERNDRTDDLISEIQRKEHFKNRLERRNNYMRNAFLGVLLIGLILITALVAWNASKQLNSNDLSASSQTSTPSDIVAALETPTSTLTPTPTDSPTVTLTFTPTLTPTLQPIETPTPYGKVIEDTLVYFYPSTNSDSRGVVLPENEVTIFGKTENGIWLNVLATFNEQLHRGWLYSDTVELQDHWNIELIPTVMTVPVPPPTSTSPPPATPTIPIPEDNNTSRPPNNNSSNESKEPDNPTPEKKPTNPPTDGS